MDNFKPAPSPDNELQRLDELYSLNILDTTKEERFDRFTQLVSEIFDMPVVLISMLDVNRNWFKSCIGIDVRESPRSMSFCGYAILKEEILIIPDTHQDPIFCQSPLVINEPFVRFYGGAILRSPKGLPLGTLCLIDVKPRDFDEIKQKQLLQFAKLVEHEIAYGFYLNELRGKVEHSLFYDLTSGLPNRRFFKNRLDKIIPELSSDHSLFVIALAFNRYKEIVNSYGIDPAQQFIAKVAKDLTELVDAEFELARCEDDSLVFSIRCPDKSAVIAQLHKIRKYFNNPFFIAEAKQLITCHMGVSTYSTDSQDSQELIDNAIYVMKLDRNIAESSFRFYTDATTKKVSYEFEIEKQLRKAIAEDALELWYQPKVNALTGKISGAEALCRWHHPSLGVIAPDIFIQVAEKSDLIKLLGEWALKKAWQQNLQWQKNQLPAIPLSINVSPYQMLNADFIKCVDDLLNSDKALKPEYIQFEITESAFVKIEKLTDFVTILRNYGIKFALDDFGTGYSSLSYLQKLPVDTLKIDKIFIKNITQNPHDAAIVNTIISMARVLNLNVVAEGVENRDQFIILKEMGCDEIQGNYFSYPVNNRDFSRLLQSQSPFSDKLS